MSMRNTLEGACLILGLTCAILSLFYIPTRQPTPDIGHLAISIAAFMGYAAYIIKPRGHE